MFVFLFAQNRPLYTIFSVTNFSLYILNLKIWKRRVTALLRISFSRGFLLGERKTNFKKVDIKL